MRWQICAASGVTSFQSGPIRLAKSIAELSGQGSRVKVAATVLRANVGQLDKAL